MPVVNARCPNCGGTLHVDNSKRAAICPFCKEAFVVEDAINNYITNNYTTIEHLHADVVNYNANPDFEIRAGELVAYHGNAVDVVIPEGVKKIGGEITGDKTWINPNYDVNYERYRGAFDGFSFLNAIHIPVGVEEIGPVAFRNCSGIKSVIIPNTVVSIGDYAFSNCQSLSYLVFQDSSRL